MSTTTDLVKVLVAMDGSECGNRAVEHVLRLRVAGCAQDIHLLNVQMPIDSGHARMFVGHGEIERYHREEGLAALRSAREILERAGVPCTVHVAVGHVAETVVRFAREGEFDLIVVGSHGRGGVKRLLLGSVATEVLRLSDIPTTVVK